MVPETQAETDGYGQDLCREGGQGERTRMRGGSRILLDKRQCKGYAKEYTCCPEARGPCRQQQSLVLTSAHASRVWRYSRPRARLETVTGAVSYEASRGRAHPAGCETVHPTSRSRPSYRSASSQRCYTCFLSQRMSPSRATSDRSTPEGHVQLRRRLTCGMIRRQVRCSVCLSSAIGPATSYVVCPWERKHSQHGSPQWHETEKRWEGGGRTTNGPSPAAPPRGSRRGAHSGKSPRPPFPRLPQQCCCSR
ncbi:hypothetical protein BD413DRAFT_160546 [Trametes elegans]|nr:hypothetical protein BD413DRAFT_160546 [Trametes elegans]